MNKSNGKIKPIPKYDCQQCGSCCKMVGFVIAQAKENIKDQITYRPELEMDLLHEIISFPYDTDENGTCSQLLDNKCQVYESRPVICDIEEMWKRYYSKKIGRKLHFEITEKMCEQYQKAF